jgi:hypothetical protein
MTLGNWKPVVANRRRSNSSWHLSIHFRPRAAASSPRQIVERKSSTENRWRIDDDSLRYAADLRRAVDDWQRDAASWQRAADETPSTPVNSPCVVVDCPCLAVDSPRATAKSPRHADDWPTNAVDCFRDSVNWKSIATERSRHAGDCRRAGHVRRGTLPVRRVTLPIRHVTRTGRRVTATIVVEGGQAFRARPPIGERRREARFAPLPI